MYGKTRCRLMGAVAALAAAAFPPASHGATQVKPRDLGTWHAKAKVNDRILKQLPRARAAQHERTEGFTDHHGHSLTLITTSPDLDLRPYAETLAGIYHHGEIEDLLVYVLPPEEVDAVCGAEASACYAAEDAATSYRGSMVIPSEDPDLLHIIVHEYGHHVDNQLINLGHIFECPYDGDGSRNWFFERDWDDDLFHNTSCSAQASWSNQLAELYAEDFTWLNGNRTWRPDMTLRSPSNLHLGAMKFDFDQPLTTRRYSTWRPMVARKRERYKRLKLRNWTFLSVDVRAPRRSDFDIYIYRANGTRAVRRSTRGGRRERKRFVLPPGSYDVGVYAYRGDGRARVRMARA